MTKIGGWFENAYHKDHDIEDAEIIFMMAFELTQVKPCEASYFYLAAFAYEIALWMEYAGWDDEKYKCDKYPGVEIDSALDLYKLTDDVCGQFVRNNPNYTLGFDGLLDESLEGRIRIFLENGEEKRREAAELIHLALKRNTPFANLYRSISVFLQEYQKGNVMLAINTLREIKHIDHAKANGRTQYWFAKGYVLLEIALSSMGGDSNIREAYECLNYAKQSFDIPNQTKAEIEDR